MFGFPSELRQFRRCCAKDTRIRLKKNQTISESIGSEIEFTKLLNNALTQCEGHNRSDSTRIALHAGVIWVRSRHEIKRDFQTCFPPMLLALVCFWPLFHDQPARPVSVWGWPSYVREAFIRKKK